VPPGATRPQTAMDRPDPAPEQQLQEIGARLHHAARGGRPALFDPRGLRGRLLGAALGDDGLRGALFQFVDVLPSLDNAAAIASHFRAYLHGRPLAGPWGRLLEFGEHPWAAWAVKRGVRRLARQFLVEESPRSVLGALAALRRIPAEASVDAVGEAVLTEDEADAYLRRLLALLEWLRSAGARPPSLSLKLTALTPRFDPLDPAGTSRRVLARIGPLMDRIVAASAQLTVDMEHHEIKPLILEVFRRLVEAWPDPSWLPGIALQAYCPETGRDLDELLRWAEERNRRIAVRLVKGAYWDSEVALAAARAWPCPVYRDKADTDAAYERLAALLFQHVPAVYPAIASHNLRSLSHAIGAARARGLGPEQWEVQMLRGMAEPLRDAVAALGMKVRVYLPTGDLITGIAYLIRRLMENTASTSILRQTYAEGRDLADLLAPPARRASPAPAAAPEFLNTPLSDFSLPENRARFAAGLQAVRARLGRHYPLQVQGAIRDGTRTLVPRNPAAPGEALGEVELAGEAQALQAIANAQSAFPAWQDTPLGTRVQLCLRAAGLMLEQRFELAAWEVLEAGKNWREADADVAEAVDYFRYYARQMAELAGWHETRSFPAERNQRRHEPCGVAVIIAPWNFPLAILAGMSAAALVAGNTAIMKPAGPAQMVAQRLRELLLEAGFPSEVCQFLPAPGDTVGRLLVEHPGVQLIAFTGSRETGLDILQRAHTPRQGQAHVKRVVCEMGGKNAIIVDEDADLDEAVTQVFASAFGYQGQKCSACSRLIAVGAVHDRFVARLAAMLEAHPMGPPEDPQYVLGPLISAAAKAKAERYLEIGKAEGTLFYRGRAPESGHYFAPAIFTGISPHHLLAREEIFAPILTVIHAATFEEALAMALDSDYALTGGVFSRLPGNLELARERFRVGNLYLNRRITGAMVAVQPFGGWRLSGTGMQAGGPDYLKQFLWSRVVSENTLRHGFVP